MTQSERTHTSPPHHSRDDRRPGDGRVEVGERGREPGGDSGRERQPLEPGPPTRFLGWLRGPSPGKRRVLLLPGVIGSIVVVIALGTWGFEDLHKIPRLDLWQSIYRAVRLYTLDLGPAGGGSRARPNPQLWLALLGAALLVTRGLISLARERIRRRATRHLLRGHVVICGAGVHGTKLTEKLAGKHDVVLVDIDGRAPGMRAQPGKYEWRLVGDCVQEEILRTAGATRAHWVVAMTGDDFVNSQVVGAMRTLAETGQALDGMQVLVQMEDPALARFLEEETEDEPDGSRAASRADGRGERGRAAALAIVSPFSPNAIAAEALLGESERLSDDGELVKLLTMHERRGVRTAPNLMVAGDHPLIDAVILSALRRWRVRILRELEAVSPHERPPLHVSLFGPDAVGRAERLCARWRPEPQVLRIEARDSGPIGDATSGAEEWLRKPDRADHVIVACLKELDGIGLTLELARSLGGRMRMTRVTTQVESVLDEQLRQRTARSEHLATTSVKSIADLACRPDQMSRLSGRQRLADALAREPGAAEAIARSRALYRHREGLALRSDSNWRIRSCEVTMLEALLRAQRLVGQGEAPTPLTPVPLSALVRAGLRIELGTAANFRAAAEVLSSDDSADAFDPWCEYVRRVKADSLPAEVSKPDGRAAEPVSDTLLRLRRATFGDQHAIDDLRSGGLLPVGVGRVTIFAGPRKLSETSAAALRELLEPALRHYDGVVLAEGSADGVSGVVGKLARGFGLRRIGYAAAGRADRRLYPDVHKILGAHAFSVREPVAMWTDILGAGVAPKNVRLVAIGGDGETAEEVLPARREILLARALGAGVAWLDPEGRSESLEDNLPTGADDILEIPVDRMTIRAFVNWSGLTDESLREQIAECIHNDYRRKHRARKPPGDPALAPWSELISPLRASNLAQADDIPSKLALVGKRLVEHGKKLKLTDEQVTLLAEAEHGRWNIERLSAGWEIGQRQVARSISPDLKPWAELDAETRHYDVEAVLNIAPMLEEAGWGVEDLEGALAYSPLASQPPARN